MFTILFGLGMYGIYRGVARLCRAVTANPAGFTRWVALAGSAVLR